MSVENWDEDFSGELNIPQQIQRDDGILKEQLGQVKSFAQVMEEIEKLLSQIPENSIPAVLEKETVRNSLELVMLSKHDQKNAFFDQKIVQEYNERRDPNCSLDFLRSVDESDGDVNVDMLTVRRLSNKANELIPQLKELV